MVSPQDLVDAERSRIEESAMYSAEGQIEASKLWTSLHWIVGGTTAIVSGVAGVLTFAAHELQITAGVLALVAAATAALHVTLRPDKRAERAQDAASRYKALQSAARRLAIDIPTRDLSEVRAQLERLAKDADRINRDADPIPGIAYRRARRNIEAGGQTYQADE